MTNNYRLEINSFTFGVVLLISIAEPAFALLSGWFVRLLEYWGIQKYDFSVNCLTLIRSMSIKLCLRNISTSGLYFRMPFAFYTAILISLLNFIYKCRQHVRDNVVLLNQLLKHYFEPFQEFIWKVRSLVNIALCDVSVSNIDWLHCYFIVIPLNVERVIGNIWPFEKIVE